LGLPACIYERWAGLRKDKELDCTYTYVEWGRKKRDWEGRKGQAAVRGNTCTKGEKHERKGKERYEKKHRV
jgi:hypothetical protein